MSKQQTDFTRAITDGGIAAKHAVLEDQIALVAPATAKEHNTIKAGIIPIACWRVEDFRFAFDSSVVAPEMGKELKLLAELIREHPPTSKSDGKPGHPLSVFGHADPTGDDDYNKQLSGRRATAIYALLTHDTNLWEKLFSQPVGDDKWGAKALEVMLDTVSPAPAGKTNHEQAIQHERNAGKRKELFAQYMEKLWGANLKLAKGDFLGEGEDAGGKGDFQGCSEFNPVLIFSEQDQKKFEQAKDKTERNSENASNRRVMVLIFRKGSRVNPSKWPCPRIKEGVAGCKKRFWSDGEKRRTSRLPEESREFEITKNTFACRFYQRMVEFSPCEQILRSAEIRFYDAKDLFIPKAAFRVLAPDGQLIGGDRFADPDGTAVITALLPRVRVFWNRPQMVNGAPRFPESLPFSLDVRLDVVAGPQEQRALASLNNLGYVRGATREENIAAFRKDHGLSDGTTLDAETTAELLRLQKELPDRIHEKQGSAA